MEEPGGLPSMGSHRVRHDWSDLEAAAGWSGPLWSLRIKGLENLTQEHIEIARVALNQFQKNIYSTDYAKAFDCVDHNKLWKILKGTEVQDHRICLLRNL